MRDLPMISAWLALSIVLAVGWFGAELAVEADREEKHNLWWDDE